LFSEKAEQAEENEAGVSQKICCKFRDIKGIVMVKVNIKKDSWLCLLIWVFLMSTGLFPCLSNAETPPKISVKPASVNFGSIRVGGESTSRMLTIKNTGQTDLFINSITLTGTNASEFDLSPANACSEPIAANGSCELTVALVPTAPFGKKTATVNISSSDPKKPMVNLKLSGQAAPPRISVVPMAQNFATVDIGNTSAPKTISIKNTGVSDLVISDIGITGSNASEFSQTNTCSVIPGGASCAINVTFMPEMPSSRKIASLSISCNDPKKPVVNVKLSGNGKGATGYSGKTTPANINADNANKIFSFAWGGGSAFQPVPVLTNTEAVKSAPETAYMGKNTSINSLRHIYFQYLKMMDSVNKGGLLKARLKTEKFKKTLNGSISGSVTYTGSINSKGTGVVSIVYDSYNDGDGITIDGSSVLSIHAYDKTNDIITSSDMTLKKLTVSSTENSISMSGSIHMENDVNTLTNTEIINVNGRNKFLDETFRLANVVVKQTYDKWYAPSMCIETTTGRVFMESEGYVDIQQVNPFVYNHFGRFNVDVPDSGGSWIFSGASGSSEKITPISISQVIIEVDADGDGFFESGDTYLWSKLIGVVYTFERVLENSESEVGYSVRTTTDGGYIIAGTKTRTDSTMIHRDLLLVKTNAVGEVEWEKTFGEINIDEFGRSVLETSDGGFVVAGSSSPAFFISDVYVVKTDADGNLVWAKTFKRTSYDGVRYESCQGYSLVGSHDGGFVIAGFTESGLKHAYLLKITWDGEAVWEKTFEGVDNEISYSVKATPDNGYIMAGDAYMIKTDDNGNLEWDKDIRQLAYIYSIDVTSDGGYIATGIYSIYGELVKVDINGDVSWEKMPDITPSSVIESADGGFVVTGIGTKGLQSCVVIKTDNNGEFQWQKVFDGIRHTRQTAGKEVIEALDGGFVIVGSADGETGNNNIPKGIYFIKTDRNGNF
jgi:hypothetical protein